MGLIRAILLQARELVRDVTFPQAHRSEQRASGKLTQERDAALTRREERHALFEAFSHRYGKLLSVLPLILMLAVAGTNMLAAVWSAFAVCLFVNLMDYYRTRFNPDAYFPMIRNASSLAAYIAVIIIFYARPYFNLHRYVGGIVISFMFVGTALSMLVGFPMTMQTTSVGVKDATVRGSWEFKKYNLALTAVVLGFMSCMLVTVWCSVLFDQGSAGQIALGIVLPLVFGVAAGLVTPLVAPYCMSAELKQMMMEKQPQQEDGKQDKVERQ